MNEKQLQELIQTISSKYFKRPVRHQVRINKRMRTTGGRYHLDDHHIEINAHFLKTELHQELIGIIKHELCHYHLHLLRRGYKHQNRDFKILLQKVGGSRYAPDIGLHKTLKRKYFYQCQSCKFIYPRVRRLNVRRVRCGKCGGKLKLLKKLN